MSDTYAFTFGALMISVFIWFFLCYRLFKILETRHPEKYESMGKPSLIMNNSISTNLSFGKFLFRREWRELNDNGLASLSKFMIIFFVLYSVVFISLLYQVPNAVAP